MICPTAARKHSPLEEIHRRLPETTVEVLTPDFKGAESALAIVLEARPDIFNHNLETCERLYRLARPGGRYDRALNLLGAARRLSPRGLTKSGVILGMGEEWDEIVTCIRDLRRRDVNILTLGQYLRPSAAHLPIARYYTPAEFAELGDIGMDLGFTPCSRARSLGRRTTRGSRRTRRHGGMWRGGRFIPQATPAAERVAAGRRSHCDRHHQGLPQGRHEAGGEVPAVSARCC
jgi:lipoate synthase